jgi:hypothetical protein
MKHSRFARLFAVTLVVTLTLGVMASATAPLATPNKATLTYNLVPGGSSSVITPAGNKPVLVMGTQTAIGDRGVGQVTMLRIPGSFLEWTGIESPGKVAITQGYGSSFGTHIVYLDYNSTVDIEVNNGDTFLVHNFNSVNMNGNVTLIW